MQSFFKTRLCSAIILAALFTTSISGVCASVLSQFRQYHEGTKTGTHSIKYNGAPYEGIVSYYNAGENAAAKFGVDGMNRILQGEPSNFIASPDDVGHIVRGVISKTLMSEKHAIRDADDLFRKNHEDLTKSERHHRAIADVERVTMSMYAFGDRIITGDTSLERELNGNEMFQDFMRLTGVSNYEFSQYYLDEFKKISRGITGSNATGFRTLMASDDVYAGGAGGEFAGDGGAGGGGGSKGFGIGGGAGGGGGSGSSMKGVAGGEFAGDGDPADSGGSLLRQSQYFTFDSASRTIYFMINKKYGNMQPELKTISVDQMVTEIEKTMVSRSTKISKIDLQNIVPIVFNKLQDIRQTSPETFHVLNDCEVKLSNIIYEIITSEFVKNSVASGLDKEEAINSYIDILIRLVNNRVRVCAEGSEIEPAYRDRLNIELDSKIKQLYILTQELILVPKYVIVTYVDPVSKIQIDLMNSNEFIKGIRMTLCTDTANITRLETIHRTVSNNENGIK